MDKRHCVVCLPNDRGNAMSAEKVCRCNGREVLLDDDGKLNVVATFGGGVLLLDAKQRIVQLGTLDQRAQSGTVNHWPCPSRV